MGLLQVPKSICNRPFCLPPRRQTEKDECKERRRRTKVGEAFLKKGPPPRPLSKTFREEKDKCPRYFSSAKAKAAEQIPSPALCRNSIPFFILHSHSSFFILRFSLFTLHSSLFTLHYHSASLREGGGPRSGGRSRRVQKQRKRHCSGRIWNPPLRRTAGGASPSPTVI